MRLPPLALPSPPTPSRAEGSQKGVCYVLFVQAKLFSVPLLFMRVSPGAGAQRPLGGKSTLIYVSLSEALDLQSIREELQT